MNKNGYVCVECGASADSIYQEYSTQVLKLSRCHECDQLVDKYVEYSVVIVVLDLMLHRLQAYRHLLFNTIIKNEWRIFIVLLLCAAYDKWMTRRLYENTTIDGHAQNTSLDDANTRTLTIADVEWRFYESGTCCFGTHMESAAHSLLDTAIFLLTTLALVHMSATNCRPRTSNYAILRGLMFAYYGNVFVVLSIVWQLHHFTSYVLLTRLCVFIAHVQVLRILLHYPMCRAITFITIATAVQLACSYFLVDLLYNFG